MEHGFLIAALVDIMAVCIDLLYGAELFTTTNAFRLLALFIVGIAAICERAMRHKRRQENQDV